MLNVILTLKSNVIRYSTSYSKVKPSSEEILRCFYFILESYLHLRLNWDISSQVGHKLSAAVCRFGICKLSDYTLLVHFIPILIQICVIGYISTLIIWLFLSLRRTLIIWLFMTVISNCNIIETILQLLSIYWRCIASVIHCHTLSYICNTGYIRCNTPYKLYMLVFNAIYVIGVLV